MPLIRGKHTFDDHFTQIPNAWLRDPRLSLKAIGLLSMLMSHQVGWQLSIASMSIKLKEGKDAIRGAIQELETVGYLERSQGRENSGQFGEWTWITKDPGAGNPQGPAGKPMAGNPMADNPPPKNNNIKNINLKNNLPPQQAEDGFNKFWDSYPKRVDRLAAKRSFMRVAISAELMDQIIQGAINLARDPNLPPKQYIPYPATWLNAGGWENEPYPEREISAEEKAERLAQDRKTKSDAERERTIKLLEQERANKEKAAPPPRCSHGNTLVSCLPCLRSLNGK
jgi:hypothetical protein